MSDFESLLETLQDKREHTWHNRQQAVEKFAKLDGASATIALRIEAQQGLISFKGDDEGPKSVCSLIFQRAVPHPALTFRKRRACVRLKNKAWDGPWLHRSCKKVQPVQKTEPQVPYPLYWRR